MLNLDEIKQKIILKDGIHYFDWVASGLAYEDIENEILDILKTYSNTHSECSTCAKITSNYYENARSRLKKLLELSDDFYLIPCGFGSTAAIKKFQEILGIYIPPATKKNLNLDISKIKKNLPLVIVGPYEHHSNELSFRCGLCEFKRIHLKNGGIDWNELNEVLITNKNRKIIASFSAVSNVTGVKTDIVRLSNLVRTNGGIVAIDASSLAAYENLPCEFIDAVFISAHKLLGGVGASGLLVIRKSLYNQDEPTFAGGGTVGYVSKKSARFLSDPQKLEDAGTPGITQLIRAFLAFKLRNEFGLEKIAQIEKENLEYFDEKLREINKIKCYCPQNMPRLPIFSFNLDGISPYEFATILSDKFEIQTRAGCSCAGPYGHDLLELEDDISPILKPGWVRIGIHFTQDKDELDYLLSAIKSISASL